jgi:hypothetical protein
MFPTFSSNTVTTDRETVDNIAVLAPITKFINAKTIEDFEVGLDGKSLSLIFFWWTVCSYVQLSQSI